MAHFAQLDKNNIVQQVIVVNNNECMIDGVEDENIGINFCKSVFGTDTIWKQTSYNVTIRKNYAGIGYVYDAERDAFIAPKPFNSWLLDQNTCRWIPPIPYPNEGNYIWDELTLSWKLVQLNDVNGTLTGNQ